MQSDRGAAQKVGLTVNSPYLSGCQGYETGVLSMLPEPLYVQVTAARTWYAFFGIGLNAAIKVNSCLAGSAVRTRAVLVRRGAHQNPGTPLSRCSKAGQSVGWRALGQSQPLMETASSPQNLVASDYSAGGPSRRGPHPSQLGKCPQPRIKKTPSRTLIKQTYPGMRPRSTYAERFSLHVLLLPDHVRLQWSKTSSWVE